MLGTHAPYPAFIHFLFCPLSRILIHSFQKHQYKDFPLFCRSNEAKINGSVHNPDMKVKIGPDESCCGFRIIGWKKLHLWRLDIITKLSKKGQTFFCTGNFFALAREYIMLVSTHIFKRAWKTMGAHFMRIWPQTISRPVHFRKYILCKCPIDINSNGLALPPCWWYWHPSLWISVQNCS